jgi:hypothetical protein
VKQFYNHRCGVRGPHAGGQIILLLSCEKWVYWSPCNEPREVELKMLEAFKARVGNYPFGNSDGKRSRKRIQLLP